MNLFLRCPRLLSVVGEILYKRFGHYATEELRVL
jgi:hypothetical protein